MSEHSTPETSIVEVESVAIAPARELEHDPIATAAMEMMRANPTPETADKVLSFLERLDANRGRKQYAAAMAEMKRRLPPVISKNRKGAHGMYATYDHIMTVVQPILSEHGFVATCRSSPAEKGMTSVTCRLTHRAGHYEECTTPAAPPDTGPGRSAVQAIGSTLQYLQRYALVMLLGLATGDAPDPDDAPREEPDTVDPKRNNAMVTAIRKRGRALADAEALVGKPSKAWTAADREEVGLWLKGPAVAEPPPADGAPTPEELAEDERRMAREPGEEG